MALAPFVHSLLLASAGTLKVMVTGAGGRTGALCFDKLNSRPEAFEPPVGLVSSRKATRRLRKVGASKEQIVRVDIRDSSQVQQAFRDHSPDAVIVCTSATPKIKILSILKTIVSKVLRRKASPPTFYFPKNASPQRVDYEGLKNQVEAARSCGVKTVVLVSSMGATDENNFLNTIGRKDDGSGGDILKVRSLAGNFPLLFPRTAHHVAWGVRRSGSARASLRSSSRVSIISSSIPAASPTPRVVSERSSWALTTSSSREVAKGEPFPVQTWPSSACRRSSAQRRVTGL